MTRTCILCEATSAGTAVRFAPRSPICDWCAHELARRGARFCYTCRTPFPEAEAIATLPTRCASCRTAYRKARYAAHQERERAAARAWDRAHPGVAAARKRARYADDADYRAAALARKRAWYRRRRAHAIAYARTYALEHPEAVRRWTVANRGRRAAQLRARRVQQKLAILRGMR